MSIYGYLNCHDCRQTLWLGKALRENDRPVYFHIGAPEDPPHWQRETLNQVMWKFMADHAGHRIDIRMEHEMTDEMRAYQEIGGDAVTDIRFDDYLAGWPGTHPDALPPLDADGPIIEIPEISDFTYIQVGKGVLSIHDSQGTPDHAIWFYLSNVPHLIEALQSALLLAKK